MKKIIIPFLLISMSSQAQNDSANMKPSVVIQARDIEYLLNFTTFENQFNLMDSVFCKKLSGAGAPSGTTNVTCDSIKAKHWFNLFEKLRQDAIAQDQGIFNRIKAALNGASFSWFVGKITKSDADWQTFQSDLRSFGRKRARRELDNQ